MSITLIKGEMWSGKTTEMFRRLRRARFAGQITRLYKYARDTRFVGRAHLLSSHDRLEEEAIPVLKLDEQDIIPNTVIGIDEGQFIEHLVEFCEAAANQGCMVIVSALSSDFNRKSFERIAELEPKCEDVIRLHAICFDCKQEASFTKKIVVNDGEGVEDIGGVEKYKAVCRKCYQKNG